MSSIASVAGGVVDRSDLDVRLGHGGARRICVVIGAAGWGKTTTAADWAPPGRAAWVRCEEDQGLARFTALLVEAVRPHLPASRLEVVVPPDGVAEPVAAVVTALCGWLDRLLHDELVLVIDDVHALPADGAAVRVLASLCARGPDRLRLVLISRRELPFSLARLRGRGEVAEVGAPELAFDVRDVADVLRRVDGDAGWLAARLWERTSGWPAAVEHAVELLRAAGPDRWADAVDRLSGPGERFHAYLSEEVLGGEPEQVRRLLRRIAVVDEIGAAAWEALAIDHCVLADLARRGLLVRRGGADGVRFALVAPLADYFAHEDAVSAADQVALRIRVAEACERSGSHGEALRHFLAAAAFPACARLLLDHGDELVRDGRPGIVLRATEMPAEYLADPRLQLVVGRAREVHGQWAAAQLCYRRADAGTAEGSARSLEPGLAWRVAALAFVAADFRGVVAAGDRVRFTGDSPGDEAELLALVASARRLMGDLGECRVLLARATRAARRAERPGAWAAVYQGLATLAAAEGDRRRSSALCDEALRSAATARDLLRTGWIRNCRAVHLLAMGSPREAAAEADATLRLVGDHELPFLTAHALSTRGRARVQLGALAQAHPDLSTAVQLFQRLGSRFLAWPLCGLGDLYRIRGQLMRARSAYEEALALCESSRDVLGRSSALTGLARVRAAADLDVAVELANQAVELGERLCVVPAHLTRGWVALLSGDRETATADAARAGSEARRRRDDVGLAEATTLEVLCSATPAANAAVLVEQIGLWRETGCVLEEAAARVVAARVEAPIPDLRPTLAYDTLRAHGVDLTAPRGAGPLAVVAGSVPALAIHSLGVFRLLRGGIPVPKAEWQSRKARDLLRILVARRRPVPREQLIEWLWPDADPARSGHRLSALLSTVREVLVPGDPARGPLCGDELTVWLDTGQIRVDVEEFLARAETALAAHHDRHPRAIELLRSAVDGYTGAFLEDDPYHDWAQPLAEELRAVHGAILRALATRQRAAGDVDGAVRVMLRLLEDDPYDEPAHRELVVIRHTAGQLGEAHRRYRIYARRMAEIGVEPQPYPFGRGG